MIGTWLVLGFFILLALGVVVVAMSGGRGRRTSSGSDDVSGRAQARARERRQLRALVAGLGALVVGVGIAVPTIVMVANASDGPSGGPAGLRLTADEAEGRRLFSARCSQCHTLEAANAVGRVGPDLDEMRPPKELILDAIEKGRARGMGQMPAGLYDGEEAENVADFIVRVAGR